MASPKGHKPYPGCETGGAPKYWTKEKLDKEADALEKWTKVPGNLFLEDFCLSRDYHDGNIAKWCKENEKFREAHRKFNVKQKSALFKGSLTKKFAHPMCALILSHAHNICAKTVQEVTNKDGNIFDNMLNGLDSSKDLINE